MRFTITLPDFPKISLPQLGSKRCVSCGDLLDAAVANFKEDPSDVNEQAMICQMSKYRKHKKSNVTKEIQ